MVPSRSPPPIRAREPAASSFRQSRLRDAAEQTRLQSIAPARRGHHDRHQRRTNFTQQFAVNGQRGTAAVFAMDGADCTDPEMGGATFTNFNVDAVEEIRSSSGWMPAEIGRGAAGFTDIITRSGTNDCSRLRVRVSAQRGPRCAQLFRPAPWPAGNAFRRSSATNSDLPTAGPLSIPGLYNGRNRTFYFAEYQGFRQVLGDTEVIPFPRPPERSGLDTTHSRAIR